MNPDLPPSDVPRLSPAAEGAFLERMYRLQDGLLNAEERLALEAELQADEAKWALFAETQLRGAAIHDRLRGTAYLADAQRSSLIHHKPRRLPLRWLAPLVTFTAAASLLFSIIWWQRPVVVAEFNSVRDAQWAGRHEPSPVPGEAIHAGQRIDLAGGQVGITFSSGASVVLTGPAAFDVLSDNSGNLRFGSLSATAVTQRSKGFMINTKSAQVVDLGTEFRVKTTDNGDSQISVTSGQVHVHPALVGGMFDLRMGHSLELQTGAAKVLTRIEQGEGTAAFRFPTIEPPSRNDYADHSQGDTEIRVLQGLRDNWSGPISVLNDGVGPTDADVPSESFYFDCWAGPAGFILFDLHQPKKIVKVNAYSWHQNRINPRDSARAVQKFFLYGANGDPENGDQPPQISDGGGGRNWTLIGGVCSDTYFGSLGQQRPSQIASSISAPNGHLGEFRYLMWEALCDIRQEFKNEVIVPHTFLGEIDIYAE